MTYDEWTRAYLARFARPEHCYGKCKEAVDKMARAFPELRKVRGHVLSAPPWGRRQHWWLETMDGLVVDPTAAQFPAIEAYEELIEGVTPVQVGRCMSCGKPIMSRDPASMLDVRHSTSLCSDECADAYGRYVMGTRA